MMVLTAKVDLKKILLILAAVAALILSLILFTGNNNGGTAATSAPAASSNDGRVKFLKDFGWEVTNTPKESSQVRIPDETSDVFDRYNALQKSQGYDLSPYAGKKVMRYVYTITNFPNAKDPVYATLLVHKNRIIGGDITNTAANGKMQPFKMTVPESLPTETTLPAQTYPQTESNTSES